MVGPLSNFYCCDDFIKSIPPNTFLLLLDHSDLLLMLHYLKVYAWASPSLLARYRDHGEVVTIAYLHHEAIWVVKEELINMDTTFIHHRPHIRNIHLLQLLLNCTHALTLPSFFRNVINFINQIVIDNIMKYITFSLQVTWSLDSHNIL